jgi:xanthine dehydrogenase accessory factor
MSAVLDTLEAWSRRGDRIAVATVVDTKRSAPQPPGTKMAVNDRGDVVGAVSGGCVEGAVVEVAERVIAGEDPRLLHYGIADSDAWDVGLPCGGEISIWVERYQTDSPAERFSGNVRKGVRSAIVTALEGVPEPGAKLLLEADGDPAHGTLGDDELDAAARKLADEAMWSERSELQEHQGAKLFIDTSAPKPRLIIVGAVDFAAQLSEIAALADWRSFVVDPRGRFATPERFPAAERVVVAWPQEAFAQLDPIDRATAIAVLTHDPKLDDAALSAALASDAGYIGAMGSRRAQAIRRERLLAAGIDEAQLHRVSAPIGLDLGALTAAETALSIMGEIIAVRRGHSGSRLIEARGRIHDIVAA